MKRLLVPFLCLILSLALAFASVSCAVPVRAEELSAGYTRSREVSGLLNHTDPPASDALAPLTDFSFDVLHSALTAGDDNLLYSPLSFLLCLGMIAGGAAGDTRAELEAAFGCDTDTLNRTLAAAADSLFSGENCKLETANSLWIREGLDVKADFLQSTADWYGAQVYRTPMNRQATDDINRWCDDHTDGMIKRILDEPLSADTMMVLINALVFDAKWEAEYEKDDILDRSFTNADGSAADVKMLSSTEGTWLENDHFIGAARDYKGRRYSFVGLLPKEKDADIRAAAQTLSGSDWLSLWQNRQSAAVDVWIPEFEGDTTIDLKRAMQDMGITHPFDAEQADFSALSDTAGYVNTLMQKTYISLDRNGTKAAAVTWGVANESCEEIIDIREVHLDRPFLYLIVDNQSGLPVFVGLIEKL